MRRMQESETLLDVGLYNYKLALYIRYHYTLSVRDANIVGFILNQSIFLALAFLVQSQGKDAKWGEDTISSLLGFALEENLINAGEDAVFDLVSYIDVINSWDIMNCNTPNRYFDRGQIDECLPVIRKFLDYILTLSSS